SVSDTSNLYVAILARPPISTLFPYTTLFRSQHDVAGVPAERVHLLAAHRQERRRLKVGAVARPGTQRRSGEGDVHRPAIRRRAGDRKSTRLNSSHVKISYAVFCLKKKTNTRI